MKKRFLEILNGAGIEVNGERPWDLQVLDERLWRRVALTGSIGFGDAYMDGWWTSRAIDELIHRLLRHNRNVTKGSLVQHMWGNLICQVTNLQRLSRAFQVGEKHYDIGNGLYRRMLGEDMVYSCGYWDGGANSLEAAQRDKLELICRKIGLQPGMKVLDIGCGWGSFCKYAAENYDAELVGVTVSRQQLAVAREVCAGLPVEIRLEDYRSLDGRFDRIVSIGMFEHVGPKNYPVFMEVARRNLKPEGLFLLHTIGSSRTYVNSFSWLTKHIFPNGHVPSIAQVGRNIEGRFVMEDLHNFGVNYDRTLMEWESNFRNAWPEIKKGSPKYDERFYRMWRFYLLSCAGAFRARYVQLWQMVLSPNGVTSGYRRPHPVLPRGSGKHPSYGFLLVLLNILAKLNLMAKKYKLPSDHFLRVEELPSVTATELKNKTADILDQVAADHALAIRRHDKPRAVLMSMEQYDALTSGGDPLWLEELKVKYHKMLDDMQSPEQKAAAERLFEATPEELGEAAVKGAQRMIESGEIKL